jgi:phosphate acetyltransferase
MLESLHRRAQEKQATIILAEAEDSRIIHAAAMIEKKQLAKLILLGDMHRVKALADAEHITLRSKVMNYTTMDSQQLVHPHMTDHHDNIQLAAAMVEAGLADGYVAGNICTTAQTIRPALKIIGTSGYASSHFLMIKEKTILFADAGFNIEPNEDQLAQIAVSTAKSAALYGITPRVALLSFSTHGSANHPSCIKVRGAAAKAKELAPDIPIDGELQFDAAFVPDIAKRKAPKSDVAGMANVFIFPDLNSGNIAYKIAERLGGYRAIGPIMQGFKKPVNDLSRGCSAQDIVDVVVITALQAK